MRRSLDHRDKAALQAALSLIDDMEDGEMDWIFGRDSPDDSAGSVADDDGSPPPNRPVRKRKRNRRKDEIVYLRHKVEELEGVLAATTKRIADANGIDAREVELISIWEEFASRQHRQRRCTEKENAKLREMLKSQVQVAKELMRFLEKQPREEDIPGMRALKQLQISAVDVTDVNHDEFVRRMDALHAQILSIFDAQSDWVSHRNVQDVHVKDDDLDVVVVETKLAWVVPFELEVVSRVLQERSEQFSIERRCTHFETLPEKDRMLITLFSGSTDAMSGTSVEVPGRLVSRSYPDAKGVVIVSELNVEPPASLTKQSIGYAVHSNGWVRIIPYRPNGETLSSSTTQHLTHIQTFRRIRIIPHSVLAPGQRRRVGMFTDIVLGHISEHLNETQQIVEDLLLQDIMDNPTTRTLSFGSASPASQHETTSPTLAPKQTHHDSSDDVAFEIAL